MIDIKGVTEKLNTIPRVRMHCYAVAGFLVLIYLLWSIWGHRPQSPSAGFVPVKPAVTAPKITGPMLKVPLKVVPKIAVKAEFPEAHIEDPDEEVIDTGEIDPAPNGAIIITTINTITGEAHTEVKIKEAPWFAFERQNYLGAGYELHFNGDQKAKGYYKRDLVRIKNIHLQGEAVITVPLSGAQGKIEGFVGGNLEYRF